MTGEGSGPRRRGGSRPTRVPAAAARTVPRAPADGGAGLDLDRIEAAAAALLSSTGIACVVPPTVAARLTEAGLSATADLVRFPGSALHRLLAAAPRRFTHAARDPRFSIEVSQTSSAFGPAIGAAHAWTGGGGNRRPLTSDDAERFCSFAETSTSIDIGCSSLHLAADATQGQRLQRFMASAKPLLAPAGTCFAATDLVEAAVSVGQGCRIMMIAPVDAALIFDGVFVEALLATGPARQGLIIAPRILIGANAPATHEGALVRFAAEAMAGVALAQALSPGQPVVVGGTFADISMRTGLPMVGIANALAVLGGAIALARRWQLPFYALGPATFAKGFDAVGTAETARWLTSAYHLGANAVIGAIGAVDLDDGISIEKLAVDSEVAAGLSSLTETSSPDAANELAAAGAGANFLATDAARRLARTTVTGSLTSTQLYETWVAAGSPSLEDTISGTLARDAPNQDAALPLMADVTILERRPTLLADLSLSIYSRAMRDAFGFKG